MKKLLTIVIAALAMGASVCSAEDTHVSASETDSSGTTVSTDKKSQASTNLLGTRKSESDEKTEVDPKGMFNKTETSKHEENDLKSNGGKYREKSSVDAAGTAKKESTDTSVSKHWTDNGETTTTTSKTEVDPKGLMNKQTAETEEKIDRSPNGATKRTVTKKLNGSTVSESDSQNR